MQRTSAQRRLTDPQQGLWPPSSTRALYLDGMCLLPARLLHKPHAETSLAAFLVASLVASLVSVLALGLLKTNCSKASDSIRTGGVFLVLRGFLITFRVSFSLGFTVFRLGAEVTSSPEHSFQVPASPGFGR